MQTERISGGRQTHGERSDPWKGEIESYGESFGENSGNDGGNWRDHSHEDRELHDGLTSARFGSGD